MLIVIEAFIGTGVVGVVCVYTLAAVNRRALSIMSAAALIAAFWSQSLIAGTPIFLNDGSSSDLISVVICYISAFFIGQAVLGRRLLLLNLRERADKVELASAARSDAARTEERTRIAREMHDIVAHRISLIALHSGALQLQKDNDQGQVQETAGLIRTTATQALQELRSVLGVLRGSGSGGKPSESAEFAPQPTWGDVLEVVDQSKHAGIRLELHNHVKNEVPDALARSAYRIVQEALTNVHKHASNSSVEVSFSGTPGTSLLIVLENFSMGRRPQNASLPGAGLGLTGLRERVELLGGEFSAGATTLGVFTVRASLPWAL